MARTNADRAEAGRAAFEAWRRHVGDPEDEGNARDAITDVLHALAEDGRDWLAEVQTAIDNVTFELENE